MRVERAFGPAPRWARRAAIVVAAVAMFGAPRFVAGAIVHVDPPAPVGATSHNLVRGAETLLLSWIEPAGDGHALVFSSFDGEKWSAPREIIRGSNFVVNRADVPEVGETADGAMVASWLEGIGENAHAYGIRWARSLDAGQTWEAHGWLHDDVSPTEHGFVSYVGDARSAGVEAFWLDGRSMGESGDTELRVARTEGRGTPASAVLDARACECCSTDAVRTADGPLVVYRDRSPDEIRDISVVRWDGRDWTEPVTVHEDGWQINGCPVNGPSAAADGERVAVAWYTAAGGEPRVKVAFSADAGQTFTAPVVVDEDGPRGQVDVALTPEGAVVVWLRREAGETVWAWRSVAPTARGAIHSVPNEGGAKISGYPQLEAIGGRLVVAWGDSHDGSRVRAVVLPTE